MQCVVKLKHKSKSGWLTPLYYGPFDTAEQAHEYVAKHFGEGRWSSANGVWEIDSLTRYDLIYLHSPKP